MALVRFACERERLGQDSVSPFDSVGVKRLIDRPRRKISGRLSDQAMNAGRRRLTPMPLDGGEKVVDLHPAAARVCALSLEFATEFLVDDVRRDVLDELQEDELVSTLESKPTSCSTRARKASSQSVISCVAGCCVIAADLTGSFRMTLSIARARCFSMLRTSSRTIACPWPSSSLATSAVANFDRAMRQRRARSTRSSAIDRSTRAPIQPTSCSDELLEICDDDARTLLLVQHVQ